MVRRKLSGLKDSLVASSIWKSDFRSALDYYPEVSVTPLITSVPLCDACHIGGRVATISFRLRGSPYDRDTLLPVDVRYIVDYDTSTAIESTLIGIGR